MSKEGQVIQKNKIYSSIKKVGYLYQIDIPIQKSFYRNIYWKKLNICIDDKHYKLK